MTRTISYLILAVLCAFAIFPLVWMIATSLKPYADVYSFPPHYIPEHWSLGFYRQVTQETPFFSYMANSAIVAGSATVFSVLFGAMAGWSLARARFRGREIALYAVLLAYLLPQILIVIPFFGLLAKVGLANSYTGLILAYTTLNFPFSTWLLTDYFRSIPREIEEQGQIDGAHNISIFFRLVLPLATPGLAVAAIFAFISSWNEFLYALIILGNGEKQVLTVGLYNFVGGENAQWGPMMAATTLTMIPTLLLFLAVQRRLVGGLTAGAVKS
ncbi:carbohydrate ABC transporter membrane protein 2, CUT1 family [Faunimonas pinastri]|uniref:Carbohydrate ABC transporter membrane protein 2, CUT1 family n=1 Tax=Faunimonas pinastri TaxID=1855383 RepID=A0A1H9EB95_9HYPH|nr:carbohydrate ABC transporter permease [Faunimonas pinastri]SEQ22857.1 carbohydrate ABC transporter membrane protein 2, CUT1 family [Faunimonas pinastri]